MSCEGKLFKKRRLFQSRYDLRVAAPTGRIPWTATVRVHLETGAPPFGKEELYKTACAVLFAWRTAFLYSCFITYRWKEECFGDGTAFSSSPRKTGGRACFFNGEGRRPPGYVAWQRSGPRRRRPDPCRNSEGAGKRMIQKIFFVNDIERNIIVDGDASLAEVLREQLGLTGTKVGCGQGHCGS